MPTGQWPSLMVGGVRGGTANKTWRSLHCQGRGHCQPNLEIEPVFCLFVAGRRVPASTGPVLALETTVVLGLNIDKCLEV